MAGIRFSERFEKARQALSGKEARAVADVVLRLNSDPTNPVFHLHRVEACDFWSARVGGDLRIILQREGDGVLTLLHVGHHDDAYAWARRHRLSRHPVTGTMQLVEIPEAADPGEPPPRRPEARPTAQSPARRLGLDAAALLSFGIPEAWVGAALDAADEDALMAVAEHLPPEAAEAVLDIAIGKRPEPRPVGQAGSGYETEDAKRAFWTLTDDDLLRQALERGWEAWTVFLHPEQRKVAYRDYTGPARVSGSAGTGKTVVALHHAKHLLEAHPGRLVLVTTCSENLANDLNWRRSRLFTLPAARERCQVQDLLGFATGLYKKIHGRFPGSVGDEEDEAAFVRQVIETNRALLPEDIPVRFACSEWERIVDVRDLRTWEAYRDAKRRNVSRRLAEARRRMLWAVFEKVREAFVERQALSRGMLFGALTDWLRANPGKGREYDHVIVDESQDLGEAELAFLAAYAQRPDCLFFAGDLGQRIKRYPFSWKELGLSLQGRSRVLKVNYRTTREIRRMADKLLDEVSTDADGETQDRGGTVSLLRGRAPSIRTFATVEAERDGVAAWLDKLRREGVRAEEIAIFFRDEGQRGRAVEAVRASAFRDTLAKGATLIRMCPMLEAKGLEYRAVAVIACDADVLPSPTRLAEAGFISGMEDIYETERNLLYVACTRARDELLVTTVGSPSELLLDVLEP